MKEGWTYKQLKDVTNKISDGSHNPPKGIAYSEYPMLGSKNILFDDFNYDSPRYLSKEDFDIENKRTDISDGDVLLTIVGTVGRTCCVQNPFIPFTLQRSVAVLKPKKEILISRFLMYALYSLSDLWENEAKGAAQKGVYLKQLATVSIPAPPISEQERIVERLDAAFAQIDELKSNAERQLAEARALFQSALTQAMQPKPGWDRKPLQELCLKRKIIKWEEVDDNVNFTYIDLSSVDRESLNIIDPQKINKNNAPSRAKQIVQMGDVIFATTRPTLRRLCLISKEFNNQICSTGYCVLRPNYAILSKWIYYSLQQDSFYHYIEPLQTGTSYPAVTDDMVKDYIVNLPTISVQSDIVSFLDQIDIHLKEIEEISRKTAAECDALKQALLRQIFE